MKNNVSPIYKRILLKLSGESLQGSQGFGIDPNVINRVVQEIKELVKLGVQVGMVIGGGNLFRGTDLLKCGITRVVSDHIGMLATVINSLAIRDTLHRAGVKVNLMSAISLNGICENYSCIKAIRLLCTNKVVILAGGTGNPLFTTDSAACMRCIEMEADIVLKGTKVDGVFSVDPVKNKNAIFYDKLSYKEVLEKGLTVMDLSAFTLARDHNVPICIFNINKSGALIRVVTGVKEGTLIIK